MPRVTPGIPNKPVPETKPLEVLVRSKDVVLTNGVVLTIQEPNALDQINLIKSMGDISQNQTILGMYTLLLSVKKWNGEPVVTSNSVFVEALIKRFGPLSIFNEALATIAGGLQELTGVGVDRQPEETDTEYSARVSEAQVNSFQSPSSKPGDDGSPVSDNAD